MPFEAAEAQSRCYSSVTCGLPLGIRRVQQPRTDRFLRWPQSRLALHPVRGGASLRAPAGMVLWNESTGKPVVQP